MNGKQTAGLVLVPLLCVVQIAPAWAARRERAGIVSDGVLDGFRAGRVASVDGGGAAVPRALRIVDADGDGRLDAGEVRPARARGARGGDARRSRAVTAHLVWIGNHEVLEAALAGGFERTETTPAAVARRVRERLEQLAETGLPIVVGTLFDPTAAAVFRRAGARVRACRAADGAMDPVDADDLLPLTLRSATPPCGLVLTAARRDRLRAAVAAINAEIEAAAVALAARGVPIVTVDLYEAVERWRRDGVALGGAAPDLTLGYLGGFFALDGIHLSRTGRAVVVGELLATLRARFGVAVRAPDPTRVAARDRLVGSRFRPAGPPPLGLLAAAHRTRPPAITPAVATPVPGYLFASGLEAATVAELGQSTCTLVGSPACTGARACQMTNAANPVVILASRPPTGTEGFVRTYHHVNVTANPSPTEACAPIVGWDTASDVALCSADVCVQPDGRVRYRLRDRVNGAAGTTIGAVTPSLPASTWRRVEVRVRVEPGPANDACEFRLDGTVVAAASNLDLGVDPPRLPFLTNRQGAYPQPVTPGGWIATFDDIAVTEGGFPGPGRTIARQGRAGTPTDNAFTPVGAGTVADAWSETPGVLATAAVSPPTGDPVAQTMLLASFLEGPNAMRPTSVVNACHMLMNARTLAPPDRTYAMRRRIDGVVTDLLFNGIGTADDFFREGRAVGYWTDTPANLSAGEIGAVKSGGAGGAALSVSDAWLTCEYRPEADEAACAGGTLLCMPPWGTTPVGDERGFANFADGVPCTTGNDTAGYTVQSCSIALGAVPPQSSIRCAVYADGADPNRQLLCASAPAIAVPNAVNTLPLAGCPTLAPGTTYWVAWNNNDNNIRYRLADQTCSGPSGSSRFVAAPFPTGAWAPSPWGTTTADTCRIISYLAVTPGGGPPAPPPGPIAAYGFEENGGATTADASGNGHTGTITGAAWTTAGRFGNALVFTGTGQFVNVADGPLLDLTNRMTLEAWVFPTVAPVDWRTIIAKQGTGVIAWFLYAGVDVNRPALGNLILGGERILRGPAALPVGEWTHLAGTYDGVTQRLYVNGVQVASRAQTGTTLVTTGPLRFGGNGVYGEYFQGRIDEVRIYDRVLTPEEIAADVLVPVVP